jgi:hypothetical protein
VNVKPIAALGIEIRDFDGLDPVTALFQDFGPGQGRVIVECYGDAWSAYFGAMGDHDIQGFVRTAGADYLANKLCNTAPVKQRKRDEAYLLRIVKAVKAAMNGDIL